MKIRDVMTPDIEVVTPRDTLSTAARLMADLGFEAIPVADNNKLVGMITAHDMAVRIAVDRFDPEATAVGQAITTDLLYCFQNENADDVAQKMAEWWMRRLPVVNPEKRVIGMVSLAI
jgi:CBS domain-containing protein